jgi:hypothetical protein
MSVEDPSSKPFDSGLQPERTALAWRRTALAIAVGALVGARILSRPYGAWALVPGAAGLALAILIMFAVHRRHARVHHRLTTAGSDRVPLHGGGLPALVALATAGSGLLCLAVVLT